MIPIHIPPLRERPEDIPALVEAFLRRHVGEERRAVSAEGMDRLAAAPWKGNARELENVLERALTLSDAPEIGPADLPFGSDGHAEPVDVADALLRSAGARRLTIRELEERYIEEILKVTGGNKVQAAKILGIDRKTLYRRAERSAREEAKA